MSNKTECAKYTRVVCESITKEIARQRIELSSIAKKLPSLSEQCFLLPLSTLYINLLGLF
jgi:hypothetical protein